MVFRALFTDDTSGVFVSNLAMVHPVSIATVTINVEPAPYNLPVALDDAFTTDEDTPLIVSGEDSRCISFQVSSSPQVSLSSISASR
ncbi:MAG: hypothetical protein IIC12_01580 [Proteobacteria bacterium]|nr:hypothetical protein [Pseudomonadota bacterium]